MPLPRLLLLACLCLLPLLAEAAPRIGLLTMGPGEEYWARFGHNALMVVEPDGRATSYNYGYFDFEQPGFLTNFLRGRMLYQLVALPADRDIGMYIEEGRSVLLQWLDLADDDARALADFLAWNARPENADYRYDYFFDNCSTRVRDAIDRALGGELQRQTTSPSRGLTARSESLRLSAPLPWMYAGIHFGLGPATDRPLSRWDESFVPQRLAEAVRGVRLADGRPLVLDETELAPQRLRPAPEEEPRTFLAAVGLGLLMAVLMLVALQRSGGRMRTAAATAAGLLWLAGGLAGTGLVLLWAFTDHAAAWANWNILLAPPWMLALLAALPALSGRRPAPRWAAWLALAVVVGAGVALTHTMLAIRSQDNGSWIALLLPLHIVLARALWQSRPRTLGTAAD